MGPGVGRACTAASGCDSAQASVSAASPQAAIAASFFLVMVRSPPDRERPL